MDMYVGRVCMDMHMWVGMDMYVWVRYERMETTVLAHRELLML